VYSEEMANAAIKLNSGHKMPMLGLGVWWADPGGFCIMFFFRP
jgi:diketogulonate reductase-like aldo/keto reductase